MPWKSREAKQAWRQLPATKEKQREYMKEYRRMHPHNVTSEAEKAQHKQWRTKNPMASLRHKLSNKYKLSVTQYQLLLQLQRNLCVVCGQPETSKDQKGNVRRLSVDHCHTTGGVRGLLCARCNSGLGHFRDSSTTLQKAIAYLSNYTPGEEQEGDLT